jgi:hypothetical protein
MSEPVNKTNSNICNICNKEFNIPYLLERHKNSRRKCKPVDEKIKCSDCNKFYSSKYYFTNHKCTARENEMNIFKSIIECLHNNINGNNIDNESLLTLQNLIPKILNSNNGNTNNSNNTQNTITNNIDSNDTTNNDNSINNTINNNINIEKLVIFPFGYENIDSLSDAECLRMLKTTKNIIPIIEKIYSQPQNQNFIRNNANKDIITVLESDLEIKTYKSQEFYRKLADGTINFLECLFYKYQPRMIFNHQLAILLNIEDLRSIYLDKQDFTDISSYLDANFQKKIQKTFLKNYYEKLAQNSVLRQEGLKQIKELRKKISKIYKDFNNSTITDEFLQEEIWSREFKCPETDPNAQYNNLIGNRFESTRRYKFIKERQDEEFAYFREHGISIGNLYKYRLILLERKKQEIMILDTKYVDITTEIKNTIMENIMNVMLNDTFNRLMDEIKTIRLIQNEEPEYLDNNSNDVDVDIDIVNELGLDDKLDFDETEPIPNVESKSSNIPERTLVNTQNQDTTHYRQKTHEELLAEGFTLNKDGEYTKPVPRRTRIPKPIIPRTDGI